MPESWFDPTQGCTPSIVDDEPDWVYHPQNNPGGERCTLQDYQEVVFGHRDTDGFANRPIDNVGIQYGLTALLHGQVTPQQFVDLNTKVGGRDIDFTWTPERTEADTAAVRSAYRSGRINDGSQLDRVPIMEIRPSSNVEVHDDVYTKSIRDRLITANGHAGNHAVWTSVGVGGTTDATMRREAFLTLDQWLAGIESDTSEDSLEVKVLMHKPVQAKDACWGAGQPGVCGDSLPSYSKPRIVAGGPRSSDILKCQLKPIEWSDYGSAKFTETQQEQLQAAFPDGVCDWTKPGVAQQTPVGVWQSFATIGGSPLSPAPQSMPIRGTR